MTVLNPLSGAILEEDYLATEMYAHYKSEFYDGAVRAMGYTSENHSLIVANLLYLLGDCARKKKKCRVHASERLLHVPACKTFVYPDVMMVCDKPEFHAYKGKMTAVLNPSVIVEVLSETTETFDRTTKTDCYKTIPSLTHLLLISQDRIFIEHHARTGEKEWMVSAYMALSESVQLDGCPLAPEDIYRHAALNPTRDGAMESGANGNAESF